jgi:hypothetical protein
LLESDSERDVDSLVIELETYMATHPSAADTVESVARWWITDPRKPSLRRVEAALEVLVRRTVAAKFLLPDGRFVYQRAR